MPLPTVFAVVDVETTGLYPKANDRVVEVAVVQLSPAGTGLDEYATLINPGRDLGPTHIHKIAARDILGAPRFQEVAGDVLTRLRSAVVVGHNVRFDISFIAAECARIGCQLPEVPTICTLRLASELDLPLPSRRLEHCCE